MLGNRRLAKRSILGTRVCAPCQDGRFYSGVIKAQKPGESSLEKDLIFTVVFDNGNSGYYRGKDLIGHGFKQVAELRLKCGQKVYLTLNGREICGSVTVHNIEIDEVLVSLILPNGEEAILTRKLEEIRLMESRKSARLMDQDTDYSKLADLHTEPKRRTVSHVIDVPSKVSRARHSTSSSTGDSNHDDTEMMMDDHMAAMVLTSLSVSPVSPVFPQSPDNSRGDMKVFSRSYTDGTYSNSYTSSGFLSSTCRSDLSDPSPPLSAPLSESAPSPSASYLIGGIDEGIDLEENVNAFIDQKQDIKTDQRPKKTMYKCTFPRCGKIFNTCPAVEAHVRNTHLEIKEDGSDLSDHEEEFYYTEIEVTVENVTKTFSDMSTCSSPTAQLEQSIARATISDHDYWKKVHQDDQFESTSVPSSTEFFSQATSTPIPISISQVKKSLSWQNSSGFTGQALSPLSRFSRPSPQERLQQHQAQSPKTAMSSSPKSLNQYKKPRSDVRKCRKVYGMENRDMWCTQCKWKKACTRFME